MLTGFSEVYINTALIISFYQLVS